ncbi:MAG: hypothetical protein IT324_09675 [Anaerolineae bacterium]|nr:hypothetical protein [Anaerolineae bacterium]
MTSGSSGSIKKPNLDDLMRLGVRAAKEGNKQGARLFFQQVLDEDKRHENAWLWLASLADNETDKRRYLETVLRINPDNPTAKRQLGQLNRAVQSGEGASMRFGIVLVVALITILVLVGAAVILFTQLQGR